MVKKNMTFNVYVLASQARTSDILLLQTFSIEKMTTKANCNCKPTIQMCIRDRNKGAEEQQEYLSLTKTN